MLSTTGGRLPKNLNRVLLRTEKVLFAVRKHPAEIAWPLIAAFVGFFAAIALTPTLVAGESSIQGLIWIAWFVLFGWAVWRYINWRATFFVITGRRIILLTGIFVRSNKTMPIPRLTELEEIFTPIGEILGYATFVIESAGQADLGRIRFMPFPDNMYEEIMLRVNGPLPGDMIEIPPVPVGGGVEAEAPPEDPGDGT